MRAVPFLGVTVVVEDLFIRNLVVAILGENFEAARTTRSKTRSVLDSTDFSIFIFFVIVPNSPCPGWLVATRRPTGWWPPWTSPSSLIFTLEIPLKFLAFWKLGFEIAASVAKEALLNR